MSDVSDVIERDGVAGRLVYVWAVWSPCDLCWASISIWRSKDRWKSEAMAKRLSEFWPLPQAIVEVFEPVTDRNDDAVAAVLARLPAPAAAQALYRVVREGFDDVRPVEPGDMN